MIEEFFLVFKWRSTLGKTRVHKIKLFLETLRSSFFWLHLCHWWKTWIPTVMIILEYCIYAYAAEKRLPVSTKVLLKKKKKKAFVITVRKNNICHVIESLVGFKAKIKLSLTSHRTLPFFQHGQLIRLMCLPAHAHTGKKDNRQENKWN